MKVRVLEVEGSAEELVRVPELRRLLGSTIEASKEGREPAGAPSELPEDVQAFLEAEVPDAKRRAAMERLLEAIASWPGTELVWPYSRKPERERTRYVRARRRRTPVGAIIYLRNNGKIHFRVRPEAAKGRRYAYVRDVLASNPHPVALILREPAQVDEAIELARQAYEEAAQ